MGFISWLKGAPPAVEADFHDSSLASLILQTELQQLSAANDAALSVAAIYRARQILADSLSALPVNVGASLVPAPNSLQDTQQFIAETVLSMEDSGDAYWRVTADGIKVLPYQRMVVVWSDTQAINRRRVYKFDNQVMRTNGLARNLIVLSMNRGANDLTGIGWLESGRIPGLIAEQKYSQEYFENNGQPSGVLKVPGQLTKDEAKLLKQQWDANHHHRSTAVISSAMDYMPTSFNQTDSQWVESHLTGIGDVANLSGVPAFLLAYSPPGSTQDYQNVEAVLIRMWRETLYPTYGKRIEAAWSDHLEVKVTFDPSILFVTSLVNRADAASKLVGVGYDPADVAAATQLPDMAFSEEAVNVDSVQGSD